MGQQVSKKRREKKKNDNNNKSMAQKTADIEDVWRVPVEKALNRLEERKLYSFCQSIASVRFLFLSCVHCLAHSHNNLTFG